METTNGTPKNEEVKTENVETKQVSKDLTAEKTAEVKTTQAKTENQRTSRSNKTSTIPVPKLINKDSQKFYDEVVEVDNEKIVIGDLIDQYKELRKLAIDNKRLYKKAISKYLQEKELKPYQAELIQMQQFLEQRKEKMIILFEGRDAAGKGGTIRRVTRYMNEKHYRVVALGKPTEEQRTQWFFQRYVKEFPTGGEIVLFDRSWYNRAMVEPVFGFCTPQEYDDFMHGVTGFERDLVRQGTLLIKLYFSVTREEQQRRFERRQNDELRKWKLSEVDMQAQDRWDDFTEKKYLMLKGTGTVECPWTIIRSDNKHKARLNAMKTILKTVNYERSNKELDYVPDHKIVISGARELELMEAQRLRSGKFIS